MNGIRKRLEDALDRIAGAPSAPWLAEAAARRRRTLAGVLVVLVLCGLPSIVIYALLGARDLSLAMAAITGLNAGLLLWLRRSPRTTLQAHLTVSTMQALLLFTQIEVGDAAVGGMGWVAVPPLIAVLVIGGAAPALYAIAAAAQILVFAGLDVAGVPLPSVLSTSGEAIFGAAANVGLVTILVGLAVAVMAAHDRTREALQIEQARTRAVVDTAADAILVTDTLGTILSANPAAHRMFGYEDGELVGANVRQLRPASHREIHDDRFGAIVAGTDARRIESNVERPALRKDGTEFFVDLTASRIEVAGRVEVTAIVRDATARTAAAKALAESEARFRAMSDACPLGIALMDAEGRIVQVNPTYERILGTTLEEAKGQRWQDPTRLEEIPEVLAAVVRASRDGAAVRGLAKRVLPSGRTLSIAYRSAPIFEGDRLRGFVSTIEDVTAQREASVELESARDRALAADRAKSEFLATMSHEIRTPMNGILGAAGLLGDTPLSEDQRELVEMVRRSGEGLLTIINDILDLSRIESGRLELEPAPFDLQAAMEDVIELLAIRAEEKGLELAFRQGPGTPRRVVADAGRIRQVMINLVMNAIKFTERGHVLVDVECLERGVGVSTVRFSVHDTGPGIPDEIRDRLFERFAQGDASPARRFGGTGLGLAISKQLVERMGGTIGVTSRPGEGSCFWFEMRLADDSEAGKDEGVPAGLRAQRALVLERSALQRSVLCDHLASWGIRHDAVWSARDALEGILSDRDPARILIVESCFVDAADSPLARHLREPAGRDLLVLRIGGSSRSRPEPGGIQKPIRASALFDALVSGWAALRPATASLAAPSREAPSAGAVERPPLGLRVLLAEDNAVNQKIAARLLQKLGCRVDLAADGRDALEMTARLPYDVVLMDCQMPDMDGYEATREIRLREAAKGGHLPVIALTANAMRGDRERCLEAGMDDYVTKPVSLESLHLALRPHAPAAKSAS